MEREHGSLILRRVGNQKHADRAASGARYGLFASLADGMGTLPKALGRRSAPEDDPDRYGGPSDQPPRPRQALAGRAARRSADRGRRRGPDHRGPRLGPVDRRG